MEDEGIPPQVKLYEHEPENTRISIDYIKSQPHEPDSNSEPVQVDPAVENEQQADFTPLSTLKAADRLITTIYRTPPPVENTLDYLMLVINEAFQTIQLNFPPEEFLNRPELLKVVDSYLVQIP
jgi:hypothetical protein